MTGAAPSAFPSADARAEGRAAKRDALLMAAVAMFNERGFAATSLDDVAARVGVTKPVIYHYLGNKNDVLFECVRRGLDQLLEVAARVEQEPGTGLERLRCFLVDYARVNMAPFGMCMVRTGDHELSPESLTRFRALKAEVDRAMRRLIAAGVADGSIAPCDVRMAAFALAGALNWPARWYDPEGPMPADAVADALVATLLSGLAPR